MCLCVELSLWYWVGAMNVFSEFNCLCGLVGVITLLKCDYSKNDDPYYTSGSNLRNYDLQFHWAEKSCILIFLGQYICIPTMKFGTLVNFVICFTWHSSSNSCPSSILSF